MGRNKILIQKIKDERIRNITYYKRKKGSHKQKRELQSFNEFISLLAIEYLKPLRQN